MHKSVRNIGCLLFHHRHRTKRDRLHLKEIAVMSFWRRFTHRKTHRHLVGLGIGFGIMMVGVNMFWACEHFAGCQRAILEASAWFVHGVGACPFMGHLEPLWHVFSITVEKEVEK